MPVQEDFQVGMIEQRDPHALNDADAHLDRLLGGTNDEPWYRSFFNNIKDAIRPPQLPPLEVTSKPVAVKDIWSETGNKKFAGAYSLLTHAAAITALAFLSQTQVAQDVARQIVPLIGPDIAPYRPEPAKPKVMGGGGGGGDRSPTPASQGKLPKIAPRQFTPPTVVQNNPNPRLVMEPTIIVQPDANLPKIASNQLGNPLGIPGPPSNGPGSGAGIGSGSGGGVGSGSGAGYGPGKGGNTGGGLFRIGGGVSEPVPIFKPEPEYSEEARKAKFQGAVLLSIVIDETGKTRDVKILRPLGLGLDEKAIEAVLKWRFRPSQKDGRSVAVMANVEVNFRLL